MSFAHSFATVLFMACREKNIPVIVLDPVYKAGDFRHRPLNILLRTKADWEEILRWLHSFNDLSVVSCIRTGDGVTLHLKGQGEDRELTIRLLHSLCSYNIPYLATHEVFERSITYKEFDYLDLQDQFIHLLAGQALCGTLTGRELVFMHKIFHDNPDVLEEKIVTLFGYRKCLQIEEQLHRRQPLQLGISYRVAYLYQAWLRTGFAAPVAIMGYFLRSSLAKIGTKLAKSQ